MKTWFRHIGVPLILASLMACAKDLPEHKDVPIPTLSALSILKTKPANGDTDVPLDTEFTITFDQKVDAYSAIPENFEVWTTDGRRVGVEKLVSTRFVPHPDFPDFLVSEITVALNGSYLASNTRYRLAWGESGTGLEDISPEALGIQSLFGARLPSGSIVFTTGNQYSKFNHNFLEVLSVSPGRILSRGNNFDFDGEFNDLFSRTSTESYVTVNKRASVRIDFSEPIVDKASEVDLLLGNFAELAPTPVDEVGNILVVPFSKEMGASFNQLFNSVKDQGEWEDWIDFRNQFTNRLEFIARTENGRRTLILEFPDECSSPEKCEYPEFPGSAVVVVLKDLYSFQTKKPLMDRMAVHGFVHYPGFVVDNLARFGQVFGGKDE